MSFVVNASGKAVTVRDPNAVLDYFWDFADVLDVGDTLLSVVFTPDAESGITVGTQGIVGTKAYAFLSGGVVDNTWGVTCHYVTTGGREDDRTLYFNMKQR